MATPISLIAGARCSGKNYITYQSYLDIHSFPEFSLGSAFDAG
jgi:hypothetical protein